MLPKIVRYIWKCYYAIFLRLIYKTILNLLCYNRYVVIQVGCTNRCLSTYTVFPNVKLTFFFVSKTLQSVIGASREARKKARQGALRYKPFTISFETLQMTCTYIYNILQPWANVQSLSRHSQHCTLLSSHLPPPAEGGKTVHKGGSSREEAKKKQYKN